MKVDHGNQPVVNISYELADAVFTSGARGVGGVIQDPVVCDMTPKEVILGIADGIRAGEISVQGRLQ